MYQESAAVRHLHDGNRFISDCPSERIQGSKRQMKLCRWPKVTVGKLLIWKLGIWEVGWLQLWHRLMHLNQLMGRQGTDQTGRNGRL